MFEYNKEIKKLETKELFTEKYRLQEMVCLNSEDGMLISKISAVVQQIDGEIDRRKKILSGEIEEIEETDSEDEEESHSMNDYRLITYSKETIKTIEDFMEWLEKPFIESGDITKDRLYFIVKQAVELVGLEDESLEVTDILQDIKYEIINRFLCYPKIHSYISQITDDYQQKQNNLQRMFKKDALSKTKYYISKINKRTKHIPISKFDRENENGETYNLVEQKMFQIEYEEFAENKDLNFEQAIKKVGESMINISTGKRNKSEAISNRKKIIAGLEKIYNGTYSNTNEMLNGEGINKSGYYDIIKKIREDQQLKRSISESTGYYIEKDLQKQNEWSVEMMEEKYNMPKNKGINDGYYEQFKGVGKVKKTTKKEKR